MTPLGVDVETSSAADLRKIGAAAYMAHVSTLALCAVFHYVGTADAPILWCSGDPVPDVVEKHIRAGGLFTGWNVIGFDRLAWRDLFVPIGFPPIPDDNWRDSMHLAAAANLPRSLDGCAKSVGLGYEANLKDSNRIRRVTDQNRTPIPAPMRTILRYGEDRDAAWKQWLAAAEGIPRSQRDLVADFEKVNPHLFDPKLVEDMRWLADRCVQDVAMEEGVLLRLPPWPDMKPWVSMPAIDRRINDRGVLIDVPLVQGLARAAAIETARLDADMAELTAGKVPATTNIEALKQWLLGRGVELPRKDGKTDESDPFADDEDSESTAERGSQWRLRKNDIANLLAGDLPDDCRKALYMRTEAAKASVRKLRAMLAAASDDGRLRGMLLLMGAQAAGRFSSGRAQLHNLVRDAFGKDYETIAAQNGLDPKKEKAAVKRLATLSLATAIEVGRTGDPDLMRAMYEAPRKDLQGRVRVEGVLPWISRMMRRTICAHDGSVLLNGDFANIQARVPVWLAGQEETVAAFARGEDLYRVQASPVYGLPPEQLTAEQRQIGKVMRLFLGFAAGANAFIPAAMIYGISIPREEAVRFVQIFRETNKPLADFWDANLNAAIWAVMYPGREFSVPPKGLVSWFTYGDCLCCRLPSGRLLRYWQPRLEQGYWQDGSPKATPDLTVLVVKGGHVFRRNLWRGLAMQNVVCGIEADLLCCALENMEEAALPVVLHVHDSVAAEVPEDKADALLPVFKQAMLAMPDWTKGLPIAADCDASARFG